MPALRDYLGLEDEIIYILYLLVDLVLLFPTQTKTNFWVSRVLRDVLSDSIGFL